MDLLRVRFGDRFAEMKLGDVVAEFCESGISVHIRRSKTDQEGAGHTIATAGADRCWRGSDAVRHGRTKW